MQVATPWQWQFPPCSKWIPKNGRMRRDQALKIIEEAEEVMKAQRVGDPLYAMELMDVIHACETALREVPEDTLDSIKRATIRKNEERGYYE